MLYTKEDPNQKAMEFINADKEVQSAEEALQGAQDIIAEIVSDEAAYRSWIRNVTFRKGVMSSAVKEEKDEKIYMKCITIMKNRCRKSCRIVY